jgi:hypothetical protein
MQGKQGKRWLMFQPKRKVSVRMHAGVCSSEDTQHNTEPPLKTERLIKKRIAETAGRLG